MSDGLAPPVAPPSAAGRRRVRRRFARDPIALAAAAFLVLVVLVAILAPWIAPHDPNGQAVRNAFQRPGFNTHLLGTDDLGRDVLSRLIAGARVSLRVAFQVVAVAAAVALPIGLLAGYFGGRVDYLLMRLMDAVMSFPPLILALAIAGILGPSLNKVMIAMSIVFVPTLARLLRAQTLAVRAETFVEASIGIGTSTPRILLRRVVPNVASPLIVQAALVLGSALYVEAALSYLGLGVQPPQASWGTMLRRAVDSIYTEGWLIVIPGLAITLTVLAVNIVADALRDGLGLAGETTRPRGSTLGLTLARHRAEAAGDPTSRAATGDGPLLSVRDLEVTFRVEDQWLTAVQEVDLDIERGEVHGLVGESGSGKTVTALAVMRLLPSPPARISAASIRFDGVELLDLSFREMRARRGRDLAMTFQDAMSGLNPALTVGRQIAEAVTLHEDVSQRIAMRRAVEMLDVVRIPSAQRRVHEYPHQFSGGMRQRAMIAMALACRPKLLIADEPTTALDVTIQDQILVLLRDLQRDFGLSVLFVTHDLGAVAKLCDRVSVMYAGQIVETAPVDELFRRPAHPYTEGLLGSIPRPGPARQHLDAIPGSVPSLGALPEGCRFHPRCPYVVDACRRAPVALAHREPAGRAARCIRVDELELHGVSTPLPELVAEP